MSNIIKIILGFCIFFTVVILIGSAIGCGEVEESRLMTLDEIRGHDIDTLVLQPMALKVIPGRDWTVDPKDTIAKYGFKGLNQDFANSRESIIDSDTLLAWMRDSIGGTQTLTYSNDSLYISGGNTVVITGFADSTETADLFTQLSDYTTGILAPAIGINASGISDLQDSLAAHRTDINAGGGGSFSSFFFNDGSTVTEITDSDTLTHVAGSGSSVSTSGTISAGVQNMIDSFGIAAVYTSGSTITRSSTTSASTLHQYYIGFDSPTITYYGAQTLQVNAIFSYVAGTTYYLQDNGRLGTSSDAEYDSAVLYCVASLGSNNYIVNLADPRHFLN